MKSINPEVLTYTTRLKTRFESDLGNNPIDINATGFWITNQEHKKPVFITNRHNLDPSLKLGESLKYRLQSLSIEQRSIKKDNYGVEYFTAITKYFPVVNLTKTIKFHPTADVAALIYPEFDLDGNIAQVLQFGFVYEDIADTAFFNDYLHPMDTASFISFAGNQEKNIEWWDTKWNFPIARTVNIASWPKIPFTNQTIATQDVVLVSGLSFSGSSGSPVMSHQKGFRTGPGIKGEYHVPPKLIGIMSGHWGGEPLAIEKHSGLSYFTRSTSILELLQENGVLPVLHTDASATE